jgi:DNA-binding MarR family transcriptional regulator
MENAVADEATDDSQRAYFEREVEQNVGELYQFAKARMRAIAQRYHPDLQPVGYGILRWAFDRPVRASEIAQHLGMDKGAVSRQITQLREMGLIETRQDPDDGRATLLVAAPCAIRVREEFRSETTGEYGRLFAEWPLDDLRDLARLLERLNQSLGGLPRK